MKKRYTGPLILEAFRFISANPHREFYLREFSKEMKISPNTAQRFLDFFLTEHMVLEFRRGNLRYFKPNVDSPSFRQMKIALSVKTIEDSGLIAFLHEKNVSHAVLFGSVAEGKDDKESDFDFVVIGNKNIIKKNYSAIQKKFDREVSLHVFSWAEWKGQAKNNKVFYRDVIVKGISLLGEKPVVD